MSDCTDVVVFLHFFKWICREWLCALVWGGWTYLLCFQVVQMSLCSKSCALCGAVPCQILWIQNVPTLGNFFNPFCRPNGAALPLPFSICTVSSITLFIPHSTRLLYSCLRVSPSQQGCIDCFGGGTELRMRIFFRKSLGLLYNKTCQINHFNSILRIWRSYDPKIEITIKIRLIAQPYINVSLWLNGWMSTRNLVLQFG